MKKQRQGLNRHNVLRDRCTLSIPEAGETAETPVKRYCNTGKVPIRTQNQGGCVHTRLEIIFFYKVTYMFSITEIVRSVENELILLNLFEWRAVSVLFLQTLNQKLENNIRP